VIPECAYRRESRIGGSVIYHCLLLQTSPAQCEGCTQASLKARGVKAWVVPHEGIDTEPMKKAVKAAEETVKKVEASVQELLPCRHRQMKARLGCCPKFVCKCTQCPHYKQNLTPSDCSDCQYRRT
jgi:hypothetical protein